VNCRRIRSRAEGDKRTERPRPRRWPRLACPVESQGAGRTGTEPEGGRLVLGGDFLQQLSVPKEPRFRGGHRPLGPLSNETVGESPAPHDKWSPGFFVDKRS
jgi:hypothetical protein